MNHFVFKSLIESFGFCSVHFDATMLSVDDRIQIVLLMARLQSVTLVRRHLSKGWHEVPSERTIRETFARFKETGSVLARL